MNDSGCRSTSCDNCDQLVQCKAQNRMFKRWLRKKKRPEKVTFRVIFLNGGISYVEAQSFLGAGRIVKEYEHRVKGIERVVRPKKKRKRRR